MQTSNKHRSLLFVLLSRFKRKYFFEGGLVEYRLHKNLLTVLHILQMSNQSNNREKLC